MLIRALIVLLLALNLGVAAWWMAGSTEPVPATVAQPPGDRSLELLREPAGTASAASLHEPTGAASADPVQDGSEAMPASIAEGDASQAPAETAPTQVPPAGPVACLVLGPFADPDAARVAAGNLGPGSTAATPRRTTPDAASGYNVFLPASADRQAALAAAARVGEAGFDDYLVVNSGAMANSVALGRYASRDRAEARRAELQAAGFPAQVQAVGSEGPPQWWLDVRATSASTPGQLRARSGAAQARAVDCATLR